MYESRVWRHSGQLSTFCSYISLKGFGLNIYITDPLYWLFVLFLVFNLLHLIYYIYRERELKCSQKYLQCLPPFFFKLTLSSRTLDGTSGFILGSSPRVSLHFLLMVIKSSSHSSIPSPIFMKLKAPAFPRLCLLHWASCNEKEWCGRFLYFSVSVFLTALTSHPLQF